MLSKKHREDINQPAGRDWLDVRPKSWWQRTSDVMRRLSFALIFFAVQAAFLSFCLSTSLFTRASGVAQSVRATSASAFPDLYEASIAELQDGMEKGHFTSEDLVKVSLFNCLKQDLAFDQELGILCKDRGS